MNYNSVDDSETFARIKCDVKEAMRSRERKRLTLLRTLVSSIRNAEIDKRSPITESELQNVLFKEAKKRKEAIALYRKGNCPDHVVIEEQELKIIESYLPKFLSDQEVEKIVDSAIESLGDNATIGTVMKAVMAVIKGRYDGSKIQMLVKSKILSKKQCKQ